MTKKYMQLVYSKEQVNEKLSFIKEQRDQENRQRLEEFKTKKLIPFIKNEILEFDISYKMVDNMDILEYDKAGACILIRDCLRDEGFYNVDLQTHNGRIIIKVMENSSCTVI